MMVRKLSKRYFHDWVAMGVALWPRHRRKKIKKEFRTLLSKKKYQTFLALGDHEKPVGFINLSLRSDYVQGSSSSPVGYVEGIYVKPVYRKQGVARVLINAAERWAKQYGCRELGSDTELRNTKNQRVHKKLEFRKASTNVHFIKTIRQARVNQGVGYEQPNKSDKRRR